jgi:hypothetical protein
MTLWIGTPTYRFSVRHVAHVQPHNIYTYYFKVLKVVCINVTWFYVCHVPSPSKIDVCGTLHHWSHFTFHLTYNQLLLLIYGMYLMQSPMYICTCSVLISSLCPTSYLKNTNDNFQKIPFLGTLLTTLHLRGMN